MNFAALTQQLRQIWQGMSPARRLALVAVLAAALAAVLGVAYWAGQPDYRVLFAGLTPEDSGAITNKLQAANVPYRLEAGGTTILVPNDRLQQTRIELASDGLPVKGGRGFELFDQTTLGMTPFTQQVNYLRALQAELARTIMQMDPVTQARVHIVRPDPSPFMRDQKPTTASVMVRLKPGTSLNRQVGSAIISVVARSVEGLTRENVTIVDASGRVLSEENNSETGGVSSQLEYRRDLENYLSNRAEQMLAQVVGPGRAVVRVTADINFQRQRQKKETYNPDGRVVSKEMITTNKSSTTNSGIKGVAGTASNLGKGGAASGSSGSGSTQEEVIQTDFLVSKTTQELEDKMGNVERLTIAALVDVNAEDKDGKKLAGLSMADAEDIIKQAVGFKTGRDDIKVTSARLPGLDLPVDDAALAGGQQWQNILSLVRQASLGVAALAALVMGWMALRRQSAAAAPTPAPAQEDEVLSKLSATAQQNPEVLAKILSDWLDRSEQPRRAAAA